TSSNMSKNRSSRGIRLKRMTGPLREQGDVWHGGDLTKFPRNCHYSFIWNSAALASGGVDKRTAWDAEFRSQGSGIRGQESGVRSQESGIRSQGSGVRNQESEMRGPESVQVVGGREQGVALTPDS